MPRPQRTYRSDDLSAFFRSPGDKPLQHSGAEVPAVQNNVDNQHKADDRVPNRDHTNTASLWSATAVVSCPGPFAISRPVRPRKSRPITKYNPVNPIRVKIASPLLTTLL